MNMQNNNLIIDSILDPLIDQQPKVQQCALSFYEKIITSDATDDVKKEALKSHFALVLKMPEYNIELSKDNNKSNLEHQKEINKFNLENQKETNKFNLEHQKETNKYNLEIQKGAHN